MTQRCDCPLPQWQTPAPTGCAGLIRWRQELEWDDQSMADAAARLAEAFCYGEISTTVGGNPEHEIVYINTILPNPVAANYADLAILGMNIRASREFANLSQFSVYMNRGLGGFHDFPSVLRDILTNDPLRARRNCQS